MAAGLQIFDEAGRSILDTTSHAARFLGQLRTPTYFSGDYSGSVNAGPLSGGRLFCLVSITTWGAVRGGAVPIVTATISGSVITWTISTYDEYVYADIYYGVA